MDFDTTATVLAVEVKDDWEPAVRAQWLQNQAALRAELTEEYGPRAFERKLENLLAIGGAPFSLLAFHNAFFAQARTAFVMGCYYPALTSVCALGERVLNHLILSLRDEHRETEEYKRVRSVDVVGFGRLTASELRGQLRRLRCVARHPAHALARCRCPALEPLLQDRDTLDDKRRLGVIRASTCFRDVKG